MVHWYVALGIGFGGLIVGFVLGRLAGIAAMVEAAISNIYPRFP